MISEKADFKADKVDFKAGSKGDCSGRLAQEVINELFSSDKRPGTPSPQHENRHESSSAQHEKSHDSSSKEITHLDFGATNIYGASAQENVHKMGDRQYIDFGKATQDLAGGIFDGAQVLARGVMEASKHVAESGVGKQAPHVQDDTRPSTSHVVVPDQFAPKPDPDAAFVKAWWPKISAVDNNAPLMTPKQIDQFIAHAQRGRDGYIDIPPADIDKGFGSADKYTHDVDPGFDITKKVGLDKNRKVLSQREAEAFLPTHSH